MKNVRCKKLIINRLKAPAKMGTFKDVLLFGSFKFPSSGPSSSLAPSVSRDNGCMDWSSSCPIAASPFVAVEADT